MFTITKEFAFSASHVVQGLREGHPCGRLHGHNYRVEVVLEADQLDPAGFVVDYGDLGWFKGYLDEKVDHRHLNDLAGLPNPTAEWFAWYCYVVVLDRHPQVAAVRVSETPKTWAEYRP
jgi:6-pyruvoyltetrahydropterin/6-carboxytetrahydropterin synthase